MKNLNKHQISVIVVSLLSVLAISYQVFFLKVDIKSVADKNIYKSSTDSVIVTDSLIKKFSKSKPDFVNDIFNFKIIKRKAAVVEIKQETEKPVEYKWVNTSELELYTKNVVSFSLFFNGKARFNINGKTQEIKTGDKLAIGNTIQKQIIAGSNESTGVTRTGSEYKGTVLSVNERSVYVDTNDKNRVVQFKLNTDARYFQRNLMQDPNAEEKESDTQQSGGDVPGRRVPRPGGR